MKTTRKRSPKKVDSPFGTVMRARREALGMKQEELSAAVGYGSRSSIVNIEQGSQMPPWDKALAIADYLRLPLEAFRQADIIFTQDGMSCRPDDVVMHDNNTVIVIEVKSTPHLVNHLYQALEYLKKRLEATHYHLPS